MEANFSLETTTRVFSGAPWEKAVGYCRAIRSGGYITISGTAPIDDGGEIHAPGDAYRQTLKCLEIIETALTKLGGDRKGVLRTRMFVTDISRWQEYGRAHSQYFGAYPPATTMVEVKRLIHSDMLIEVEAEAEMLFDRHSTAERVVEWHRDDFLVSTDRKRLDLDSVHAFLTTSYWAKGRSKEAILRTIQNSVCFGLYQELNQIGFARVATDFTVLAYLLDVYVLEPHRGKGLGAWIVECVLSHPQLRTVKWILATTDAHGLYRKYGFEAIEKPQRLMERKSILLAPETTAGVNE